MKLNLKHPAYVIAYAAVTAAVFTGGIMALHVATAATVERNRRLLRQRALVKLFQLDPGRGELTDEQVGRIVEQQTRRMPALTDPKTHHTFELIEARDASGRRIGYAFDVWGVGFWARIDGLLAVDPSCSRAIGVTFLKHSETPGLGARITEDAWTEQFRGLDVRPPPPGGQYIYIGRETPGRGDPRSGRFVDAVTGATGTSKAVETFLNRRIAEFRRAAAEAHLIRPDADRPH